MEQLPLSVFYPVNVWLFEALTKTCKACQVWEKRKDTPEYYNFIEKHECIINHTGPAGSMVPADVLKCFEKSLETRKLRCANYIGDEDSKDYHDVVKADPYKGFRVMKGEWVGHIQDYVVNISIYVMHFSFV